MLKESDQVNQNLNEDHRRWFFDTDFDLVLWQRGNNFTAFQLCYNKQGDEHAVTWDRDKGFEHFRVDPGEPNPLKNMAPMMVTDGRTVGNQLLKSFAAHSRAIDPTVTEFVLERLEVFSKESVFRVIGGHGQAGVYIIWIKLREAQELVFGRFRDGQPITMAAGWYLYVGSARATRGAATMANRLLRHASRSGKLPPHRLRQRLASQLADAGMPGTLPAKKTLHWHIDYLLDLEAASLRSVIIYRAETRIEKKLAEWLEALPETEAFAPGLGASDHPGGTHVFRVDQSEDWWEQFPSKLLKFFTEI